MTATDVSCPTGVSPEQKLESCTVVIQSAGQTRQVLVAAYRNRGVAYNRKGGDGPLIADFDDGIRLKPDYAKAYHDRGVVYGSKRDYARANCRLRSGTDVRSR